jgi:eukaryotic-like serine/threonine-protein kinase
MLSPGTRVGTYEITGALGSGGMGEVYRARDTTLHRDVAIKILPDLFASDPQRLARFEREAQTLAALNHPNIAQIYGVHDGALVMEFVDGEDLAERISRGPLRGREALPILRQIADALDAAHDRGIVHRDLKPANVCIRRDGTVKVLDFGLARVSTSPADLSVPLGSAPTFTSPLVSQPGVVMGTVGYMSPEQARGLTADARTDIWALGCIAYEMLTGRRAFPGATASDVIAAILEREPELSDARLSGFERRLIARCLAKDPRRRYHDAGDVALAIEDASSTGTPDVGIASPRTRVGAAAVLIAAAALAAGLTIGRLLPRTATTPITRIAVPLPADKALAFQVCSTFAVSPDGSAIAYVGESNGTRQLFVRGINEFDARAVRGGEDATDSIVFSPDGKWLAFYANGQIRKVPVTGGAPSTLATLQACGADWPSADRLLFSDRDGIFEIPAAGGQPRRLVATNRAAGELTIFSPFALPGGKAVLFTLLANDMRLYAQRLDTGERIALVDRAQNAVYTGGEILYSDAGVILRVPFDPSSLRITGTPAPLLEGAAHLNSGATPIAIARSARALAYAPGGTIRLGNRTVVMMDASGTSEPIGVPAAPYLPTLRLSPDGRRLAITKSHEQKNDIYVYDFERGTLTAITSEHDNRAPVWSADGTRIIYSSDASGVPNLYWRAADGSGREEPLLASEHMLGARSPSPDGGWLVFNQLDSPTHASIHVLPLQGDRRPRPFAQGRASYSSGIVSPDGGWLAYVSDETSREEVYVQPFPAGGSRLQISVDGGRAPVWSRDGRRLFYRSGSRVMVVDVEGKTALRASRPRLLFDDQGATDGAFDVMPDGKHFLALSRAAAPPPLTRLNVLTDWK